MGKYGCITVIAGLIICSGSVILAEPVYDVEHANWFESAYFANWLSSAGGVDRPLLGELYIFVSLDQTTSMADLVNTLLKTNLL